MSGLSILAVSVLFVIGVLVNTYSNWCSVKLVADTPKIYRSPLKRLGFMLFNVSVSGVVLLIFVLNKEILFGIAVLLIKWGINRTTYRYLFRKEFEAEKEYWKSAGEKKSDSEVLKLLMDRVSGKHWLW